MDNEEVLCTKPSQSINYTSIPNQLGRLCESFISLLCHLIDIYSDPYFSLVEVVWNKFLLEKKAPLGIIPHLDAFKLQTFTAKQLVHSCGYED